MTEHLAVLVEDDPEQADISAAVLESAGFRVIVHRFLEDALAYLESTEEYIDLFVLDRRLPMREQETATDEFGDALFSQVRKQFPDARVIVFTGYASVELLQDAMQGSGQFPIRTSNPIDRITVLTKDQSLEFRTHVQTFRALLQELDDIELQNDRNGNPIGVLDQRALRRVAYEYEAVSLTPTCLAGGLTGATVWRCELHTPAGRAANVVVKTVDKLPRLGGLQDLLPLQNAATTRATISGLVAGKSISILQLAGDTVHPLSDLLATEVPRACILLEQVIGALNNVSERHETLRLDALVAPVIGWQRLSELLQAHSVAVPAPSNRASTNIGMRHGDLHASNVMVDGQAAVLIDFDNSGFGSGLIDPVTLLISSLVHPDSPIRGSEWPPVVEISNTFGTPEFGRSHGSSQWFAAIQNWIDAKKRSDREFWGIVLAYSTRQLKYEDVMDDEEVLSRVLAIANRASAVLRAS